MELMLNDFEYDKARKVLSIKRDSFYYEGRFPREVKVKSHITGRIIKFVMDEEAAIQAEFWDGEMYEYIPAAGEIVPNVATLVIYNG
jgi:hypothetical protein